MNQNVSKLRLMSPSGDKTGRELNDILQELPYIVIPRKISVAEKGQGTLSLSPLSFQSEVESRNSIKML